ncbi:LysR family transcriptional regulator [Vibrio sp. LaRot3]|uniref:LysR family transcriptional regulator n=1 Tax=Vibrio sp. LaRot3 TaxID=2998829 RepID=UPI0022CE1194|nr:LysR family transcriptional regulator [Vibrio sp. LaRot3]MDA0148808.1 LysR family transcriptional regulator [Vibrio sp. LaRot3]
MAVSDDIQWRNIDLNLLVTFSYLYRYRSVSVAAEKSFISQSAMSHSLARLRVLLDDGLFERKGHKMEPTDHAHHIAPIVHRLLDSITHELLTKSVFTPKDYNGVCRIGLTDYAEFIFAPVIYDAIREQAPNAQISFVNVNRSNYVALVENEKLDLVIGSMPVLDDNFDSHFLYTEKHVCLADKQMLGLSGVLDKQTFASIEHALVSPDGSLATQVDKKLAEHGLTRRVTVASRNFLTIRSLLKQRRLIAIVPEKMAMAQGFDDQLSTFTPPVPVADFDIAMLWHTRLSDSEKGQWLRGLVAQAVLSE